ncbi:acylphosphatase [Candidatus Curtissbacteria bacterium RBG_13_35_7]|uniref:Acylphosphatase n=1 Tax=Candidatus Curtissbacteria bacterium RBG_13_35_7 TaxID=1797705 RepID=A0A1F5G2Y9_9BACT|nr:MAG: acylphosphatase [Candidatus Curtissbacteria bacterium RBG_13_35_7]
MAEIRLHIKIYGQVQGVFFRQSAKIKAEELGLVGWVKNCEDGSVETIAQGEKDKLDEFIKWCRKGPPFSVVENVSVKWVKDVEDFSEFSIV